MGSRRGPGLVRGPSAPGHGHRAQFTNSEWLEHRGETNEVLGLDPAIQTHLVANVSSSYLKNGLYLLAGGMRKAYLNRSKMFLANSPMSLEDPEISQCFWA